MLQLSSIFSWPLLGSNMTDNHLAARGTLSIISDSLPQLKESAQKTARYILNHPRETVNLTVTELSKRVGDKPVVTGPVWIDKDLRKRVGRIRFERLWVRCNVRRKVRIGWR